MKTHNIQFQLKNENHPKLSQICSQVIYSEGLKKEFETAVVNEPSVFEPLKFYCTLQHNYVPKCCCINVKRK